jgi:4-hydroxy-3-polyprenylbenzoate decarboxylase
MADKQDLRSHLATLEAAGKLHRITRPINKDTELGPLVRWQFRGLPEEQRAGFLFENVTDSRGRGFAARVAVGIYASSTQIYALGMGATEDAIRDRWLEARANPIPPVMVEDGPVQEEVHMGDGLLDHDGIEEFPVPNFTPGFDVAPYTTASNFVTRDPDSGALNVGNYRGQIKGPLRMGVFINPQNHGGHNWRKHREAGRDMEVALVIGGPPALTFTAGAKLPYGVEEYSVAGSLIGEALRLVKCKTVDLLVPAAAELVIEGTISSQYLEPEAPYGEYTGYMGRRTMAAVFEATCITHRKDAIFCGLLSQMPPSESSKMKKIAQDANYLHHLRTACNLPEVLDVWFDEIAVDAWCVLRLKPCNPAVAWQALHAVMGRQYRVGKMVIAVDEDIDPSDRESVLWALAYRMMPEADLLVVPNRGVSLDPSGMPPGADQGDVIGHTRTGSAVLINAMRKWDYPPVSLPARQYMERAREIWDQIGLPALTARTPWHGYDLGDWSEQDRTEAERAAAGEYTRTGDAAKQQRRSIKDGEDE